MSATNELGNNGINNRDKCRIMEQIVRRENMTRAYKRVVSNKGCEGLVDMEIEEMQIYLKGRWENIIMKFLK